MICSIIEKVDVWSPAGCSPRKTCKARGIYTSKSSFVACFGV